MARYEVTDFEWKAIQPHPPNKPRGVPQVDDRRVLNSIFSARTCGAHEGTAFPAMPRCRPQSLQNKREAMKENPLNCKQR